MKSRVGSAGAGIAFVAAQASVAKGAIVEYEFTIHFTGGALAGNEYTGAFTYDDASPPIATNPPEYSPPAFDVLPLQSFGITIESSHLDASDFDTWNSPGVRVGELGFRGLGGIESGEQGYGGILIHQTGVPDLPEINLEESILEGHDPSYVELGTVTYSLVPEPASMTLGAAAVATLGVRRAARWLRRRPTSG
jgi:hypothetical protein